MGKNQEKLDRLLAARADPLVKLFKRRANNPAYYERIRSCVEMLTTAAKATQAAAWELSQCVIDRQHASEINAIVAVNGDVFRDIDDARVKLPAIGHALDDLAWSIRSGADISLGSKRGPKPLKYLSETKQLVELYEQVTGKPFPSPKDVGGENVHPSTHFVTICLKKLDATWLPKNTTSNVRRVLDMRNAVNIKKIAKKYRL